MSFGHGSAGWFEIVLVVVGQVTPILAQPSTERLDAAKIEFLIKELSSPNDRAQQEAAAKLEVSPEAIPALRKAVDSTEYGLYRRAKPVLRAALLKRALRSAEQGSLDLFIERFVRLDDSYEVEAHWRALAQLAGKTAIVEDKEFSRVRLSRTDKLPIHDFFDKYTNDLTGRFVGPGQLPKEELAVCMARRESLTFTRSKSFSFLASPGIVRVPALSSCVIMSGSSVTLGSSTRSIIIADGDVQADSIENCVVVASGSVVCERDAKASVIVAGGEIQFGTHGRGFNCELRASEPKLLGWVNFFETIDAGIEVAATGTALKVLKVVDGKPFAEAQVKAGDLIHLFDGAQAASPDTFRRLVRKKAALGDDAALKIRRSGKDLQVKVRFAGPAK